MRPPTQSGASDIFIVGINASGVEGGLGPDAAGEKGLQWELFWPAVDRTYKSR